MFRRVSALLTALPLLAACSGGSHPHTTVTTPSDTLSELAAKGAAAAYTATYAFHQMSPDTTATVQVWHADPSLRVDVVVGGRTATLLTTSSGTYSCSINGSTRSCLLVAGPGAAVPAPFDVAPASLFSADLKALATQTTAYDVRAAPAIAAAAGVPAAQCFDVAGRASVPTAQVPAGRYCFAGSGLLAAATYPSGNTVRLTAVTMSTPAAVEFTPYAKPTPLPS